jgi:hypothetical protein
MKTKILYLFILMLACESAFSQSKEVEYNAFIKKPYEFVVNKIRFRFRIKAKEDYILILEKYTKKWEVISDSIECESRIMFRDINNDGYIDFGSSNNWDADTWLYNPIKNVYIHSGFFPKKEFDDEVEHMKIINEKSNVYYYKQYYKRGEIFSVLFQISDYKKIKLGVIRNETQYSEENGNYITKKIVISKSTNDKTENVIQEIKWDGNKEFDDATYWKNNWQKFLKQ